MKRLHRAYRTGFTLIELLVVIATIAILAGMLLPTLTRAKQKAQGIACMNNHRQLTFAWLLHASDNEDRHLFAQPQPVAGGTFDDTWTWITGTLDFAATNRSNWDPGEDIKSSPLWPYCSGALTIFKCPADQSTVVPAEGPFAGRRTLRVRSICMSAWFADSMYGNFRNLPGMSSPPWRAYKRLGDLVDPGPSMTSVFWDEREDTINTGSFGIDMTGWSDARKLTQWVDDLPASYHAGSGGISFSDGHSQLRHWQDARTRPPLQKGKALRGFVRVQTNNPDIIWLQERSTRRLQ